MLLPILTPRTKKSKQDHPGKNITNNPTELFTRLVFKSPEIIVEKIGKLNQY